MNFSENLSKLRKEKGITQEELAEKLDISRQAVSKWECGASLPDLSLIPELCQILGATTDQLLLDHEIHSPEKKEIQYPKEKNLPVILISVFLMVFLVANMGMILATVTFIPEPVLFYPSVAAIPITLLIFTILMIREFKKNKRNQ